MKANATLEDLERMLSRGPVAKDIFCRLTGYREEDLEGTDVQIDGHPLKGLLVFDRTTVYKTRGQNIVTPKMYARPEDVPELKIYDERADVFYTLFINDMLKCGIRTFGDILGRTQEELEELLGAPLARYAVWACGQAGLQFNG